jgi:hypothetical protein
MQRSSRLSRRGQKHLERLLHTDDLNHITPPSFRGVRFSSMRIVLAKSELLKGNPPILGEREAVVKRNSYRVIQRLLC